MIFSICSEEVSGGLFEVVASLESSPRGTGVGKAVAITRSSPREKATGLKVSVPEGRESSSEQPAQLGKLCLWLLAARQPSERTPSLSPRHGLRLRAVPRLGISFTYLWRGSS